MRNKIVIIHPIRQALYANAVTEHITRNDNGQYSYCVIMKNVVLRMFAVMYTERCRGAERDID